MRGYEEIGEMERSFYERSLYFSVRIKHLIFSSILIVLLVIGVGVGIHFIAESNNSIITTTTSTTTMTTTTIPTTGKPPESSDYSLFLVNGISKYGDSYDMTKYIEVLSMDSLESKICPENCKYPLTVSYSSGGVLKGGKVVICGGGEVTSGAYPVCFSLNQTVQWNFQAVMKSDRMGGASAAISGRKRLWVTGGVPSAHGRPPKITETVTVDGYVSHIGSEMQEPRAYHCMLSIGYNWALLIGGKTGRNFTASKSVLMSRWAPAANGNGNATENSKSVKVDDLIYERYNHACTLFHSEVHENRIVALVAGGLDRNDQPLNKTEIWDYTQLNTPWQKMPDLPIPMGNGPRMTSTDKSGVFLTYGKDIWRFKCNSTDCQWVEQEKKLQIERYGHTLLAVPSDQVNCPVRPLP